MIISQNTVNLKDICISNDLPITLIAGPCVLENYDHAKMMVEKLKANGFNDAIEKPEKSRTQKQRQIVI